MVMGSTENSIASLPLLMGTSEENTHCMLASIGVIRISKNGSVQFLTSKMSGLIGKFELLDACEVTNIESLGTGHK
eukprot:13054269-Ditylum_brightwellii.AAC.2